MDGDVLVPLFGIFCAFGLPIIALIVTRVLAHRERIEMIRQGMVPPGDARAFFKNAAANAAGARRPAQGYDPSAYGMDPATAEMFAARRSLERGIRLTLIGLAIFIGLSFIDYSPHGGAFNGPDFHPGPWLLGGLIPMFVGVSQIIIALLSGARFGISPGMPPWNPPPPGSPGTPGPSSTRPYRGPWPSEPPSSADAVAPFKPPVERGGPPPT